MVLHPGGCGRVSYRRQLNKTQLNTKREASKRHHVAASLPFCVFHLSFARNVTRHAFSQKPAQGALARLARVHVKAYKEGSESSGFDTGLKGLNPFPHPVL